MTGGANQAGVQLRGVNNHSGIRIEDIVFDDVTHGVFFAAGPECDGSTVFNECPKNVTLRGLRFGGGAAECNDGIDNDGDTNIDTADAECGSLRDNDESTAGIQLAINRVTNEFRVEGIYATDFEEVGADPPSECVPGQIFIDTDETDNRNCTTTADNSLCLCYGRQHVDRAGEQLMSANGRDHIRSAARLLREELRARQERSLEHCIRRARLPERWVLETFPFAQQPGVRKAALQQLASLDFIPRAENIVLVGDTGSARPGSPPPSCSRRSGTATGCGS